MMDLREAIWKKRPDVEHKPWPFDIMNAKERRAYQHNPIATIDLCFMYADAAIATLNTPCEYCNDGKRTGLPGNACENCMNTRLKFGLDRN